MFGTLSCCINKPATQYVELGKDPDLVQKHQKLGLITDFVLGTIILTAGVLTLLAISGVNIGALNAMAAMGPIGGGVMVLTPIVLLIANLVGLVVVVNRNAKTLFKAQPRNPGNNDDQIQDLRFEIQRLEGSRAVLQGAVKKAEAQAEEYNGFYLNIHEGFLEKQREVEKRDAEIAQLKQNLEQAKKTAAPTSEKEVQKQLNALEAKLEIKKEELAGLEGQIPETRRELGNLVNKTQTKHQELQKKSAECETIKKELANLKRSQAAGKSGLEQKTQQLKELESKVTAKNKEFEAAQQAVTKAQSELQALKTEIAANKQTLEASKKAHVEAQPKVDELTTEVQTLKNKLEAAEKAREESAAEASTLKGRVQKLETELSAEEEKTTRALEESQAKSTELKKRETELNAKAEEANQAVAKAQAKTEQLKAQLQTLQTELKEAKKVGEQLQATNDLLRVSDKEESEKANQAVAKAKAETEELKTKLQELEASKLSPEEGKTKSAVLTAELKELETQIAEKKKELDKSINVLQQMKTNAGAEQKKIDALRKEHFQLEADQAPKNPSPQKKKKGRRGNK